MRRASLVLVVLAVLASCDDRSITEPRSHVPGSPRSGISDGAHEIGGLRGNEDFFLLPPLVQTPTVDTYRDRPFHGTIRPRIEICLLATDGTTCEATVKEFAPEAIAVSLGSESYSVNWDTKAQTLLTSRFYRIEVFVQEKSLGFADIDPMRNGSEMRNVNTDEFIPLVDGRTLPIRFRIEQGATCEFKPCTEVIVDKETGGTFYAVDRGGAIQIPADAMPVDNVLLTIERKPVLPNELCVSNPATPGFVFRQWEGCYVMKTDPDLATTTPRGFQQSVIVGVCIEPGVPEHLRDNIQLLKHDDGVGIQHFPSVAAPFLNCTGFAGTPAPISGRLLDRVGHGLLALANRAFRMAEPRPLQAIDGGLGTQLPPLSDLSTFFWGLPITATIQAGENQVAAVGTAVAVAPSVLIRTAHDHPGHPAVTVDGAPITFRITGGGGKLVNATGESDEVSVISDGAGTATLPAGTSWRLGSAPGLNTLEAAGPFIHGSVQFSAQALGADLSLEITAMRPEAPTTASRTVFEVTVTNTGAPTSATTITFDFGASGVEPVTLSVPEMVTGATTTLGVPAQVLPAGSFTAVATLDPDNDVPEADEGNNVATFEYTVAEADGPVVLLTGLHYPKGLWIGNEVAYLTETAGHNVGTGGNDRVLRFDLATGGMQVLLSDPVNNDAVVSTADGFLYLTSYAGTSPGESGNFSRAVPNPETGGWIETQLLPVGIASHDLFLDANGDIYLVGSSDSPDAASMYRLPFGDYVEGAQVIRRGLGRARAVTKVGDLIYYSDFTSSSIRSFVGDDDQLVVGGVDVTSLSSDGTWLYYAEFSVGRISRVHLATGARETLLEGLRSPSTVRYHPASGRLYFLEFGTQDGLFRDGRFSYIDLSPSIP